MTSPQGQSRSQKTWRWSFSLISIFIVIGLAAVVVNQVRLAQEFARDQEEFISIVQRHLNWEDPEVHSRFLQLLEAHPSLVQTRGTFRWAALSGQIELNRQVLQAGGDINLPYDSVPGIGPTFSVPPIYHAIEDGNLPLVDWYLDHGADPNVAFVNDLAPGSTLLHVAVKNDDLPIIETLLNHGANVAATNDSGHTSLFFSVVDLRIPATELLLERGANPNAVDDTGRKPLDYVHLNEQQRTIPLSPERKALLQRMEELMVEDGKREHPGQGL